MLKEPNFAIFIIICFVVATELQFYYVLTAPFLMSEGIGIAANSVSAWMTIGQMAEIFVMAFVLSWSLKHLGMRKTLAIGVIAWPIRYVIFSIGAPVWLVLASLSLHGFCYVFFFVAAFIHVDQVAPRGHPRLGAESHRHGDNSGSAASSAPISPARCRITSPPTGSRRGRACFWCRWRSPLVAPSLF